MNKEDTSIPVSTRLPSEIIAAIKLSGKQTAEFLREAVEDKLSLQNLDYLQERIKEKEEELKILRNKKNEIEGREKEKDTMTPQEIEFFVEADKILKNKPEVLDGRIDLYTNLFMKPFKLTRKEFLSKIVKAQLIKNGTP